MAPLLLYNVLFVRLISIVLFVRLISTPNRNLLLQITFIAGIFTKHLTFPSGFGILFRQGLIDRRKSGCSAAGSVLDWGSRGRRFKSCHSDHAKPFFRWKERLFCNLFDVFKILKTAFGVCLVLIRQKARAFPY